MNQLVDLHVRQTATLSSDEQRTLFGWGADPFGVADLNLEWRPKDWHLLFERNGQPISHVGILRHKIRIGHRFIRMFGLGAVITIPDAQGRGHASRLIRHARQLAVDEWKMEAGMLFCVAPMVTFYERLGWTAVGLPVLVDQPSGRIISPIPVMVHPATVVATIDTPLVLESRPW